jgi:hypothetical protein
MKYPDAEFARLYYASTCIVGHRTRIMNITPKSYRTSSWDGDGLDWDSDWQTELEKDSEVASDSCPPFQQ